MTYKNKSLRIILVSLLFAGLMITSSLILNNSQYSEYAQTVNLFLIALWFIPYSYFSREFYCK